MNKQFSVQLTLSQLRQWIACSDRLAHASPQENFPLIDVVKDSTGHEIKIYVDIGQ